MSYIPRTITQAPSRLVEQGKYQLGCFNTPVKEANLLDYPNPYVLPLPNFLKSLQLREWQAFQIMGKGYFIMVAIYNAKKVSLAQFIVYDIQGNKKTKYEKKVASWDLTVPSSLYGNTIASYSSNNFNLEACHDLDSNKLKLKASIRGFRGMPNVEAEFHGYHSVSEYTPMVVCNPFSAGRVMYSHKCLMPMKGYLKMDDWSLDFQEENSQLILDDHKGYYPYPTEYDWVTGMGRTEENQLIGFNLTNNQVIEQDKYNENCLWFNGELHPLPPIQVSRPEGVKGEWKITDEFDWVNLVFKPVIHTSVNLNLILLKSKYEGPYGFFTGYLRKSNGEKVVIKDLFGMGEDFYLRA
ncbi:MAG: DUF2804 domain-containing protein [Bacteroidia bacterium]|nr:DUF2804 domain-containing protein [Bacteroidia bacterium]